MIGARGCSSIIWKNFDWFVLSFIKIKSNSAFLTTTYFAIKVYMDVFLCMFKKKIWKTFARIKIAFVWWIKNSKVLSCSVFQSKCKFDVEMLANFGFDWRLFFKSVLDIEFGFCCYYFFFHHSFQSSICRFQCYLSLLLVYGTGVKLEPDDV